MAEGFTHHAQAMSSRGFSVDESICEQLEALWAAGFETVFSCGGDRDGVVSPGYLKALDGYIAFVAVTEAQLLRIRAAAEFLKRKPESLESTLGFQAWVLRFRGDQADGLFAALLAEA